MIVVIRSGRQAEERPDRHQCPDGSEKCGPSWLKRFRGALGPVAFAVLPPSERVAQHHGSSERKREIGK